MFIQGGKGERRGGGRDIGSRGTLPGLGKVLHSSPSWVLGSRVSIALCSSSPYGKVFRILGQSLVAGSKGGQ